MPRQKIFALLCGINDYTPNVGRLNGCLNDVDAYDLWLTETFPVADRSIRVLKDSAATRQGIISGFREHLSQAGPHDVALFQFAGHGARWKSSAAFNPFYPDGFDEGLVCWDSRRDPNLSDNYDLADKELAVLVAELAQRCPHVVVLLDCCHSGSGTRSADDLTQLAIRLSHQIDTERPLESYLAGYYSHLLERQLRLETPASRHILLAACERKKQAFEGYDRRGIFSSTLLEQLDKCHGKTTYADLFLRVRATVQKKAHNQTPQFEVFRGFDGHQGFLGAAVARGPRKIFAVNHDPLTEEWTVDFGAIHGFVPVQDKPLEFAIVDAAAIPTGDHPSDARSTIGAAVAKSVGLTRSLLQPTGELPTDRQLFAEITSLPACPMLVSVSGDTAPIALLREELRQADVVTIELVDAGDHRNGYGVEAVVDPIHGPLYLIQNFSEARMVQGVRGHTDFAARHVIRSLAHIAEWESRRALQNHHSHVKPEAIPFQFVEQRGAETIRHVGSHVRLSIGEDSAFGKLVTENKTGQSLYSLLAYFSDDYGMTILDNDEFPDSPHERTILLDGSPDLELFLDANGPVSAVERFMLIVSNQPMDQFLLGAAEQGETAAANMVLRPLESGIIDPFKGRKIRTGQHKIAQIDWFTRTIEIQLVRSGKRIGDQTLVLDDSPITVRPHSHFSADVQLQPATNGRGTCFGSDFWRALVDEQTSLVTFSQARGQNLAVLEFSNIQNAKALLETPLQVEVAIPLQADEALVALTFDGEHILLAGDCHKISNGTTCVSITEIPADRHGARSIVSTLRLYLFKTYFKRSSVNSLRAVNFKKNGTITLERHMLRERVAEAKRVVLLIHGLLGNGATMANALHPSTQSPFAQWINSQDPDTLFLVWDYEQLSTTLQTSALDLLDQLSTIGMGAEDGKELVIVGHSIGGLMARWLVEQGGGHVFVDHLVLLGVPNAGAPIGKVGLAVTAGKLLVTVAVNLIPGVAGFASYFLSVLINLNRVTATIEQLDSDGEFLRQLNASEDPHVRYTVFSGDIHDIDQVNGRLSGLLLKLGQGKAGQMLFDNAAHDVFVSVGSSRSISKTRTPAPQFHDLPCHHFGYMTTHAANTMMPPVQEGLHNAPPEIK